MSGKKIFSLSAKEKTFCVALAKKSILHFLQNNSMLVLNDKETKEVPKKLLEEKACFVTLAINHSLRGCIGHLQAMQPLYKDIIENAVGAAFSDPRFPPLNESEFDSLNIEVSILTDPIEFSFSSPDDLLKKFRTGIDGLIIRKGYYSATFLPSVWEELPEKEQFLSHLCMKAGLSADAWKEPGLRVQRYESIKAKEK